MKRHSLTHTKDPALVKAEYKAYCSLRMTTYIIKVGERIGNGLIPAPKSDVPMASKNMASNTISKHILL